MKKQTAVEWLVNELRHQMHHGALDAITISKLKLQAKAMEKEQIRDNYIAGFNERDEVDKGLFFNPLAVTYCEKVFNQYYNETYK